MVKKKKKKEQSLRRKIEVVILELALVFGLQFVAAVIFIVIASAFMGTFYETDPANYKRAEECFPESLEEYTVNGYSFTEYSYLDYCCEEFLDLTVTEEQLQDLLDKARSEDVLVEREAYYAEGYYEIVHNDYYRIDEQEENGVELVAWARISKLIYNPQTRNVVFVWICTHDSSVYEVKDLAYFNRFGIIEEEYVQHLPEGSKGDYH